MAQRDRIKMHNGKAKPVTDYRPTERDRAIEANYESAAHLFVQLQNLEPEELVVVPMPGNPNALLRVKRWQLAAHELRPFDLKLIALMSTQADRITAAPPPQEHAGAVETPP